MTLGDIISRLHDDAFAQEALASLDDLALLARLRHAADAAGVSLGTMASAIVGHFVQHADSDAWLSLMTLASREADPAAASLHRMLLEALPEEAAADQHDASHQHGSH